VSRLRLSFLALCLLVSCTRGVRTTEELPSGEERLREAARLRGVALAAMEDGAYQEALPLLDRLEELLPDNVLPPVNRAICHFQLGRTEAALEAIARARELAPENPQVLFDSARILAEAGEAGRLDEILDAFSAAHPHDPRAAYLRGETLLARDRPAEALTALELAVRRSPDNLVLLTNRVVAAAEAGDADAVLGAVDAIEDRLNGFEGSLSEYARALRGAADDGETARLPPAARVLRNILRPTDLYRQGLLEVAGGRAPGTGMYPQLDFDPPLPPSIQGGRDIPVALRDGGVVATAVTALARVADAVETDAAWLAAGGDVVRWPRVANGAAISAPGGAALLGLDLDQDALPDLLRLHPADGLLLHRGRPDGGFEPPRSLLAADPAAAGLQPLDLDHDGDLDLLILRRGATDLYLENRGDTWHERAREVGLGGPRGDSYDAASADLDDDGDLDLLVARGGAPLGAYRNDRLGTLADATASWGLEGLAARRLEVADFDADGLVDLAALTDEGLAILLNRRHGFEERAIEGLPAGPFGALSVADFDNDGDPDLVVASPAGTWLVRNRGGAFAAEPQDLAAAAVVELVAGDWDGDGDLDLLARAADGSLRRWDNDGGARNHWLRLRLRGNPDNNSKNNTAGLFARIEMRIGSDFRLALGNGAVNHLGLGARREADVVRVVWTNGLGQTWARVASRQTLVEEQVLKGSCPFLYTWDGERFRFVTDLMWKSPLGMPLPDGSPAPHQSARDFVLVPGELLRPAGGELWLQVTEELWETAYVDRQRLLAVDHPEDAELIVDERFSPPPHAAEPPLHWVRRTLAPVRAMDQEGRDVLPDVARRDRRYVGALPLDRYQGLTRGHRLELAFRDVPRDARLRLVLHGWTFPTDSSINVALAQDPSREARPPRLSVLRGGVWHPLDLWLGFPNGKDKAVVADLTGLLPAGAVALRIESTMQVYWDAARLAVDEPDVPWRATWLEPSTADLHERGFSRLTRASEESPHRFDYERVSVEPRFRDMAGLYTRFGAVGELLAAEDDRTVVMGPGDEMTVRFDAGPLPELPSGWRRDWVLYTDGWVKDADINTRFSGTVEPLPFHSMDGYPDPSARFPHTPAHRAWLEEYQTRRLTGRPFRDALRRQASER
jgi:hypothetical protein